MPTNKDINEALLLDILSVYSDAEDKLLTAVAKRVAKGITEEGWNEKKLKNTQALQKEIEKILGSTSKLSKAKISKGIIDAYKQGFAGVGGPKGTHGTILDELDIPMNLKMQVLATNNLLDNATFQVLRKANDAYQEVMAHSTTGLLAGVDTRIQASQKMLNEFASKGITSFVDKAGRNWDLSSYAEMCARTVGSHAALQGHIDRQVEVGEDLVKVSTIGTTCPICQRWQGVVLSISGNHPKYHSIDEAKAAGLFHPNCKHTLGMYIPELDDGTDHEGKVEPAPLDMNSESSKRNKLIEQQRANERKIRYWKKRKALAITPEEQKKCDEKIKYWQHTNLLHCEKHSLRRQYAREGVMKGVVGGQMSNWGYGGHLKAYEELYKDVIGESPKKAFGKFKMQLQFFADKSYDKWLKEEIQSLDQLDIDKAMMKDASNKNVTPTSLYKKYIGDNPIDDYAQVSLFHKGTKEFKSHYAKWLKTQIEEIGVSYKIKPQYTEVHEDIPEEDTKLSATEIYKKYHDSEKPTDAYKKLGGEEGTGMKYGKWVENQKKELIKNGITKTVPFNAATDKTAKVIANATSTIQDAKLVAYKAELDNTVTGAYTGSQAVKKAYQELKDAQYDGTPEDWDLAEKKYEIAKQKHVEMVKKKAQKSYGTPDFAKEKQDLLDKLLDMAGDDSKADIHAHIDSQYKAYEEVEKEKKKEEAEKAKKAKALKQMQDAILNKKSGLKSGDPLELLTEDEAEVIARSITKMPKKSKTVDLNKTHECWDYLIEADGKTAQNAVEEYKKMEANGVSLSTIQNQMAQDMKQVFAKNEETLPLAAAYDYTVGSGVYNRYKWGEKDMYTLSSMHRFMCNSTTGMSFSISNYEYGKKMSQYYDEFFEKVSPVKDSFNVKRLVDLDGFAPMLGLDKNASASEIKARVQEINAMKGQAIISNSGFTSTSTYKEGSWNGSVALAIKVNAGTKAVYGEAFSHYQHGSELETLLKAGQPMRVIKIYEAGDPEYDKIREEMGYQYDANRYIAVCETIPE